MKRSEVNQVLREGHDFIRSFGYVLPPFGDWSAEVFRSLRPLGVIRAGLGWHVTDFGRERFSEVGSLAFVARNEHFAESHGRSRLSYTEKVMVARKDQLIPMHRHSRKAKDVVNRGGGVLAMQLYMADSHGMPDTRTAVELFRDGERSQALPGSVISLAPGESMTLLPDIWHAIWAENADVLLGEVASSEDKQPDCIFADTTLRTLPIEEDVAPFKFLVTDYGTAFEGM